VANSTKPKQESYSETVEAQQYFVRPPSALNAVGISIFRRVEEGFLQAGRDP
jgi:hypothetical protein